MMEARSETLAVGDGFVRLFVYSFIRLFVYTLKGLGVESSRAAVETFRR